MEENEPAIGNRIDFDSATNSAFEQTFKPQNEYQVKFEDRQKKIKKWNKTLEIGYTYVDSCSSIIDAFITSRLTTGPIRMLAYWK